MERNFFGLSVKGERKESCQSDEKRWRHCSVGLRSEAAVVLIVLLLKKKMWMPFSSIGSVGGLAAVVWLVC